MNWTGIPFTEAGLFALGAVIAWFIVRVFLEMIVAYTLLGYVPLLRKLSDRQNKDDRIFELLDTIDELQEAHDRDQQLLLAVIKQRDEFHSQSYRAKKDLKIERELSSKLRRKLAMVEIRRAAYDETIRHPARMDRKTPPIVGTPPPTDESPLE